jgi:hypothetical protein
MILPFLLWCGWQESYSLWSRYTADISTILSWNAGTLKRSWTALLYIGKKQLLVQLLQSHVRHLFPNKFAITVAFYDTSVGSTYCLTSWICYFFTSGITAPPCQWSRGLRRKSFAQGTVWFHSDQSMLNMIEQSRLTWLEHMGRREEGTLLNKIFKGNVGGKRIRGRPRKTWLKDAGMIWEIWENESTGQ